MLSLTVEFRFFFTALGWFVSSFTVHILAYRLHYTSERSQQFKYSLVVIKPISIFQFFYPSLVHLQAFNHIIHPVLIAVVP